MNTKNLFVLPALIAAFNLLPAGRVPAQTFTVLHSSTHSDRANPWAGLITNPSGNILYGTARAGGVNFNGTVFAVNSDGAGFTNLHNFAGGLGVPFYFDGGAPVAALTVSGGTLYGTASGGGYSTGSFGTGGNGTIFKVNTNGTGYTTLYFFSSTFAPYYTNSDGVKPHAGLVLSGNTLYGTALSGGSYSNGTVFAINTDGTGFTNLHSFAGYSGDGANPTAGLMLSGNTLYGTTGGGGSSDKGTIFAINTDGTGFTNLYSFTALSSGINSDGANPTSGLILSGNTLYGTAEYGGSSSNGTVFAINTDGKGFANLHSFTGVTGGYYGTNSDGANPYAGLILSGKTLYGTASGGGSGGAGTVFSLYSNGTGFTNLHSFTAFSLYSYPRTNSDGVTPYAGLVLSGNTLYGTASEGGVSGYGTVFSISLPLPQLTVVRSGTNVILSWPTNVAGFDYTGYTLQSTTNLNASTVWGTNSLAPVAIAGQNTVTNLITGPQQFYRLVQ